MSRREFGRLAAGVVLAPELASIARSSSATSTLASMTRTSANAHGDAWPRYDSAYVLDFLASPGPFNTPVRVDALTPEMLRNAASSGITAVNLTIGGRTPEDVFRDIAKWERDIRCIRTC